MARSILAGDGASFVSNTGEFEPVTHYPPLYAGLIAAVGLLGIDIPIAARIVNALFFAANIFLVGSMAGPFASLVMLTGLPSVQVHSMAWTEGPFLFFGFLGLYCLSRSGSNPRMVYLAAASIALACLLRYAGAAFVLAGVVYLRRGRVVRFLLLSVLPIGAWVARNLWNAGTATNRTVGFHPPGMEDFAQVFDSVLLWLFPVGALSVPAVAVFALVVIAYLLRNVRHELLRTDLERLAAMFLGLYVVFILFARSVADIHIPFDIRLLSPAWMACMIIAVPAVARSVQKEASFANACLVVFLLLTQSVNGALWLSQSYQEGIGYAHKGWRASALMEAARAEDAIFTNAPDIVYVLTGKRTQMIPWKVDPKTRLRNDGYEAQMSRLRQKLRDGSARLVYFEAPNRLWYLPSKDKIEESDHLGRQTDTSRMLRRSSTGIWKTSR